MKGVLTDVFKHESIEMMCEWLAGDNNGELVTVGELREKMTAVVREDAVYKTRTVKEQLEAKYGDHVLFTSLGVILMLYACEIRCLFRMKNGTLTGN